MNSFLNSINKIRDFNFVHGIGYEQKSGALNAISPIFLAAEFKLTNIMEKISK